MTPNLTYLLNFIQIVEWGNISKAAAYLNIAQPALSRQIQSLEADFGTRLLRRRSWGVEPTEDGKLILEHARRIQKECVSAQESVQSNQASPVGSVYLGVPSAYAVSLVPPLLQRMRTLYPNIMIHVVEAFSGTVYEWLISGRLDMAILYHSNEHLAAEITPFLQEEMVALTAPERQLDADQTDLSQLADNKIIAAWRPHLHRLTVDEAFLTLGVPFTPRIEIDSLPCMIELARRGEGVAILPPSCVIQDLSDGRLAASPLRPSIELRTVLGQTPNQQPKRAVKIVAKVLRSLAEELAPRTGWSVSQVLSDGHSVSRDGR